jgi:SsrA-binding protein
MSAPKDKNGAKKEAPAEPTAENRRARYEYEIFETVEAGLVLTGTEIKSIRTGHVSISEAYVRIRDDEAWLVSLHVPPYKEGSFSNHEPNRPRKLLLHREQIESFKKRANEKGFTIVPLRLYFTRGMAKVLIGAARGKKLWDKRKVEQDRDVAREMARAVRR